MKKFVFCSNIFIIFIIIPFGMFFSAHSVYAVLDDNSPQFTSIESKRFIVKFRSGQSPDVLKEQVLHREAGASRGLERLLGSAEDVLSRIQGKETPEDKLTKINNTLQNTGGLAQTQIFLDSANESLNDFYVLTTDGSESVARVMQQYRSLPEVEYIEPDTIESIQEAPDDPAYTEGKMWGLAKIHMEEAWNQTKGSDTVKVAVVDTGINYNHEDFAGRTIMNGTDFATCAACDINDICIEDKERDDDSMDDKGHGTHVAGTIASVTNNSTGVAGINWNVSLIAVKVLGRTGCGRKSDIVAGIKYAADQGADVINLSLGGSGGCDANGVYQAAVDYARGKGSTIVVAAGNNHVDAGLFEPASCNGVISVAAVGPDDQRASYSDYGTKIDIAAPGGNLTQDRNNDGFKDSKDCIDSECIISLGLTNTTYSLKAGTSMAAPHVAGVAALLLAKIPSLSADQIEQIIKESGDPITTDQLIGKRLNANNALLQASGATITAGPSATPGAPTATGISGSGCPDECAAGIPKRSEGNADCNDSVNDNDFTSWKEQYQIYQSGSSIDKDNRTADFYCQANDALTQKVDLVDFEVWRSIAFSVIDTPSSNTPTPTGGEGVPTPTPTPPRENNETTPTPTTSFDGGVSTPTPTTGGVPATPSPTVGSGGRDGNPPNCVALLTPTIVACGNDARTCSRRVKNNEDNCVSQTVCIPQRCGVYTCCCPSDESGC